MRLMCFDKDQYDFCCGYISSANIDIFRPTTTRGGGLNQSQIFAKTGQNKVCF